MAGRRAQREPDERPSRAALADGRDVSAGDGRPRPDGEGEIFPDDEAPGDGPPPPRPVRGPGVAPQPRPVPADDATPAVAVGDEPRSSGAGPATPAGRERDGPPRTGPVPAPARSRRSRRSRSGTAGEPEGVDGGPPPQPAGERPGRAAAPRQGGESAPEQEADGPEPAVAVEATTGAPVDALPSRVPVRQPKRWRRLVRGTDGDPAEDDPTFWPPIEEVHWDGTPIREEPERERDRPAREGVRRRRRSRRTHPPDPLPGLAALLALSLVAAFFAWVSAGPLWVAVGHATRGTSVITECAGSGLAQRCRGIFTAEDRRFVAHGVRVSGVPADRAETGRALPARMTGPDGGTAYADTGGAAQHLRWLLGLLAVAACAAGIARWTGATRLKGQRARRWATAVAFAGPALITVGFLVAAW
ncbi:hypothetical protein [Micromonospora sp. WP24]|uniref:hypothetical protein n=1 Tax=Micromonospora sp. WP24 TaxID=2604469 RepID=UPI002106CE5C|nr:hypothetical protein [Micromonospora sp. WP24]